MAETTATSRAWTLLWVTLILLVAAGSRMTGIANRPVWTDEGFMAWISTDVDLDETLDEVEFWDRHSPLYVYVLAGWRQVAGDSRLALRFWAVMSGIIATALVYRIGADHIGVRAGQYAALLFAVLQITVDYGQEMRAYGWLVMVVCSMAFFFLRYLRHPRPRWLIGFTLSIALMLYTVYLGVLLLAVMGLITLLWRGAWRHRFALLGAVAAGVVLFTPWLIVMLRQSDRMKSGIEGAPGTYATTWDNLLVLSEFVLGEQLALMAGLWLLGAWALVRPGTRSRRRLVGLFLILAGMGLYCLMLVVNLGMAVVAARTLVFITPFLMLVCGVGLARVASPAREVLLGTLLGLSLVTSPMIQAHMAYDDVAITLAAMASPGDLVILETGWDDNPFYYELGFELPAGIEIIRTLPWVDPGTIMPVVPQVEGTVLAHDRVWVVQWLQASQVMPWLDTGETGYHRVLEQAVGVGEEYAERFAAYPQTVQLVLYERPGTEGEARLFGEQLALQTAVSAEQVAPGDLLHVDLWWQRAEAPLERDYSVGVYLMPLDEDLILAQHDGPPGEFPTSQWETDVLYFDRHTLAVPADLPPGDYRVAVRVYWFGDGVPLAVEGGDLADVAVVTVR